MHTASLGHGTVTIRARGALGRDELLAIAAEVRAARAGGREVLLDLRWVDHLHFGGAAELAPLQGLRILVSSRYVTDLLRAGGVLEVEDAREGAAL